MNKANWDISDHTKDLDVGSWLPSYKAYEKKGGECPVPFWYLSDSNVPVQPFRSENIRDDINLAKLIESWRDYYNYLRNQKMASTNTARIYMSDVISFQQYLSQKYLTYINHLETLSNYEVWLSKKPPETDEDRIYIKLALAQLDLYHSRKHGKESQVNANKWDITPEKGLEEFEQLVPWLSQSVKRKTNNRPIGDPWKEKVQQIEALENITESQLHEIENQIIALFHAWKRASKNNKETPVSDITDIVHRPDILSFEDYLKKSKLGCKSLNRRKLIKYQNSLLSVSKHKRTTVSLKTSALRSAYEYLIANDLIKNDENKRFENNPVSKGFRVGPRALPRPLNKVETERLLKISDTDSDYPKRDLAILEVLYSCGIRLSEIHTMNFGDIDLDEKQIHIRHGKGNNKHRYVLFGNPAYNVLNDYLHNERRELVEKGDVITPDDMDGPVFLNQYGGRLGERSIQKIVRKYADKAGLTTKTHPHTLRHSFATHMLEEDEQTKEGDLRVIQELMGHESPVSTGIYTKLANINSRKAYFAFHPRANIET